VSNPAAFLNSTAAMNVVKQAFAAEIGVGQSKITMSFAASRRLTTLRQLSSTVTVTYSITAVASTVTTTILGMQTTFITRLQNSMTAAGLTQFSGLSVTAIQAAAATTTTTTTTTTTNKKTRQSELRTGTGAFHSGNGIGFGTFSCLKAYLISSAPSTTKM